MQPTVRVKEREEYREIDYLAAEVERVLCGAEEGALYWSTVLRRAADRLERRAGYRYSARLPRRPRAHVADEENLRSV